MGLVPRKGTHLILEILRPNGDMYLFWCFSGLSGFLQDFSHLKVSGQAAGCQVLRAGAALGASTGGEGASEFPPGATNERAMAVLVLVWLLLEVVVVVRGRERQRSWIVDDISPPQD